MCYSDNLEAPVEKTKRVTKKKVSDDSGQQEKVVEKTGPAKKQSSSDNPYDVALQLLLADKIDFPKYLESVEQLEEK